MFNRNSKIIIIGFGSIGQRHYKNIIKLGYNNVCVFDVDAQKTRNHKNAKIIDKINIKNLEQFDVAFICSPTHLHMKHALLAAQAGCHLFIEKPLSHKLARIDELDKMCARQRIINMIACNMRFQPCLKFIKSYLENEPLGKIYAIHHEFGSYLPGWRKTDYRKNFAAKKSTGGGIILDDIHEFDLLFWLNGFKPVATAKFIYNKVSDLEIETEDSCVASFKFKNKVLGSVRCDYLQQSYARNCKIVGAKGNLEWDFNENIVWLKNKKGAKKIFQVKNWDVNQMYIEEIKYFLDCVKKRKKTFNGIKQAAEVLKYCIKR